jgi:hypothetical protein
VVNTLGLPGLGVFCCHEQVGVPQRETVEARRCLDYKLHAAGVFDPADQVSVRLAATCAPTSGLGHKQASHQEPGEERTDPT